MQQYLHTYTITVGGIDTDETHNSLMEQLWEGLLCMFHTVGLVWFCHKARLFSRGRRHSDQTLLPQTQTLTNAKANAERLMILSKY